jgi:S1/P1 Nuclease
MLTDKSTSPHDKAMMLAWLFHLVGDTHQPLHSTALFSEKLLHDGDRGRNRILTVQRKNLHSLWDGLPGNEAKLRATHNEAAKLMADADLAKLGESAAGALDEETWLNESRELAIGFTYSPELMGYLRNLEREGKTELQPFDFDPKYLKAGGKICDRRIVQAGYRLAAVLKQILD